MELGASFGHPHIKSLGLDVERAIRDFKSLNLSWIRLGCYWSEVEKEKGKFSFYELDKLIDFCDKNKIKVVLTVGMKAPRWPEYYIPDWFLKDLNLKKFSKISLNNKLLLERVLRFIGKCVGHFRKSSAIKIWQVENEPLDPSGKSWWRIDEKFLRDEVNSVRRVDCTREVLISLWGNELSKRNLYKKTANLADVVGLDIYLRHPIPFLKWFHKYMGPLDSMEKIKKITNEIKNGGKKVWITELQAEPWEPNEVVAKSDNPPSFLPKHFEKNLFFVKNLSPEVIFLWGFEYWLWRKKNGDYRYWKGAERVIKKFNGK